MQPQLGFSAHSVSQLQAAPPLAFSSQYQPCGHKPLPHGLQLPSSQLGLCGPSSEAAGDAACCSVAVSVSLLSRPASLLSAWLAGD